jgi:hypothetical protein
LLSTRDRFDPAAACALRSSTVTGGWRCRTKYSLLNVRNGVAWAVNLQEGIDHA